MQKGFSGIFILIAVLVVITIAGGAYYVGRSTSQKPIPAPVITSKFPKSSTLPTTQPTTIPSPTPAALNLNLILKYGVSDNPRNILDTFKQTYTKDMVADSDVTVNFLLSDYELKQILQKMSDINLFDYPNDFSDPYGACIHPYYIYDLKVAYNSENKHLSWKSHIKNPLTDSCPKIDGKVNKLNELGDFIISIIESKDEYKKLPTPNGGYL